MFTRLALVNGLGRCLSVCLWVLAPFPRAVYAQPKSDLITPETAAISSSIKDGELVAAIYRAGRGAHGRLKRDACVGVLAEFADSSGRSLSEVQMSLRLTSGGLLRRMIFRDGRDHDICRTSPAVAFTGIGSRVVFVCGSRFTRLPRERAELTIIHELLHTLGLGERPPSSDEIDRIVARRCGS
jgi:hypothetical protein